MPTKYIEQGHDHIAYDGIGVVLINCFELRLSLKEQASTNLTASDCGYEFFQIRDLTNVGRLINEART